MSCKLPYTVLEFIHGVNYYKSRRNSNANQLQQIYGGIPQHHTQEQGPSLIEEVSHEEILKLTGVDFGSELHCYTNACGFPEDEAHVIIALDVLEIADGRGFNFSVADANR